METPSNDVHGAESRLARVLRLGIQVSRSAIRFGANENQVRHTFRHIDRLGRDRASVTAAIVTDLTARRPFLAGSYVAGNVTVRGIMLEYRAFLLNDGTINIGRIMGA